MDCYIVRRGGADSGEEKQVEDVLTSVGYSTTMPLIEDVLILAGTEE